MHLQVPQRVARPDACVRAPDAQRPRTCAPLGGARAAPSGWNVDAALGRAGPCCSRHRPPVASETSRGSDPSLPQVDAGSPSDTRGLPAPAPSLVYPYPSVHVDLCPAQPPDWAQKSPVSGFPVLMHWESHRDSGKGLGPVTRGEGAGDGRLGGVSRASQSQPSPPSLPFSL